jgi:hypothetical protein
MGNPEEKIPLGKPMLRWKDNIQMYLREIGWGDMDYVNLTEDRDQ